MKIELIPTISLLKNSTYVRTYQLPAVVHLDDPAINVMTDFKYTMAFTIHSNESLDHALAEMKIAGVHLLLVVDDDDTVIGLISSEDILGEKPIQFMQSRRIQRSEITVHMMMTPREVVQVFDLDEIRRAKVAQVVDTLRSLRQHYILVVKFYEDQGKQVIRGLIATSQISKQLHKDINSMIEAQTLAELRKRHS